MYTDWREGWREKGAIGRAHPSIYSNPPTPMKDGTIFTTLSFGARPEKLLHMDEMIYLKKREKIN